jgi:hypothetical protein
MMLAIKLDGVLKESRVPPLIAGILLTKFQTAKTKAKL